MSDNSIEAFTAGWGSVKPIKKEDTLTFGDMKGNVKDIIKQVEDEILADYAKMSTEFIRSVAKSLSYTGSFNEEKIIASVAALRTKAGKLFPNVIVALFAATSLIGYTNDKEKLKKVENAKMISAALKMSGWKLGSVKGTSAISVGQVESVLPNVKIAVLHGMKGVAARFKIVIRGKEISKLPICSEWGFAFLEGDDKEEWALRMKERSVLISTDSKRLKDCLITYQRHPTLSHTSIIPITGIGAHVKDSVLAQRYEAWKKSTIVSKIEDVGELRLSEASLMREEENSADPDF